MENSENGIETKNKNIKKGNKLPIVICIVIIVLLLAIICILLFGKESKNSNNQTDNSSNNISDNGSENEQQNNDVTYEYVDIKNQLDNVYVNGKKQNISLENPAGGRVGGYININGKEINYDGFDEIIGLFQIDEYVLVITRSSSFVSGAKIYVYDLLGEQIQLFYNLGGNNVIPTVTDFMDEAATKYVFNISNNKMKVYGHQVLEGGEDVVVLDKNNEKHIVNICSKSELNSYGINGDTIFYGEYELIYAGKGIFNIELVEGTSRTFSDEWKAQNCN